MTLPYILKILPAEKCNRHIKSQYHSLIGDKLVKLLQCTTSNCYIVKYFFVKLASCTCSVDKVSEFL